LYVFVQMVPDTFGGHIQFVGRILRVVVQNAPNHPDNYGHIITHAGMNLDKRLKEFKLFEKDDQQFWEEVIGGGGGGGGGGADVPRNVQSGESSYSYKSGLIDEM